MKLPIRPSVVCFHFARRQNQSIVIRNFSEKSEKSIISRVHGGDETSQLYFCNCEKSRVVHVINTFEKERVIRTNYNQGRLKEVQGK